MQVNLILILLETTLIERFRRKETIWGTFRNSSLDRGRTIKEKQMMHLKITASCCYEIKYYVYQNSTRRPSKMRIRLKISII